MQGELFANPAESGLFVQVAFNRRLGQSFAYQVPTDWIEHVAVGKRVLAPFGKGNKPTEGFIVDITTEIPTFRTKAIHRVLDETPLLTPVLFKLTKWMADYYLCGWGQVLDSIIPAGAKHQAGTRLVQFVQLVPEAERGAYLSALTPKQREVLAALTQAGGELDSKGLAESAGCGPSVVQALVRKGYARLTEKRTESAPQRTLPQENTSDLHLNTDQARALSSIEQALSRGGFHTFLLHGVTGSGKTEIYLRAIEQAVRQGREALVLVPEISLTPQTIARFHGRFPNVAVLHSHLGEAERGWHWRRIAAGEMQVIVGARSAVFAPTRRLGLIVVDEEHEASFKQETTPRYHGRDLAVMRGQLENIPVVLGSATPSLESWHNARRGQYTLLTLPARVLDRPLPPVHLIDLRNEPIKSKRFKGISPTLERAIGSALAEGGQVILLLNRRGFDTQILCPACGHVVKCRFCDVALTHHKERDLAICHYCGFQQQPPSRCPGCALGQVRYVGQGTEKLENELERKFPNVPARRMDSDTMKRGGSHAETLNAFRNGEIKILFGTQMIAKGLDFPNVTLVGVISADTALYHPDFRSAERTFQLLAQVAGRTGRGPRGGRVLVQTFNPEHPCIALAAKHEFVPFAEAELKQREEHGYPPFARMARLLLRGKEEATVVQSAEKLAETLSTALATLTQSGEIRAQVQILGPAEAPLLRLKGYYRHHCILLSPSSAALHAVLRKVLQEANMPSGLEMTVDVDPLHML